MPRIRRRLGNRRGTQVQDQGVGAYSFAQFLVILLGIFVIISNLKTVLEHEQGEIKLRTASIQQRDKGSSVDHTLIDRIVEEAVQKAATKTKSEMEERFNEIKNAPKPTNEAVAQGDKDVNSNGVEQKDNTSEPKDTGSNGVDQKDSNSESTPRPRKTPRIPNVLVAGVQRGGTTSLTKYLSNNFNACSNKTDPSFFADTTVDLYAKLYSDCTPESKILVDGSPDALMYPEEIKRLYGEAGSIDELKIIVTLREPVERELSSYTYRRTQLENSRGGMNLVKRDGSVREFPDDIRDRLLKDFKRGNFKQLYSNYAVILSKWFELFDRKQILILSFNELKTNQTDYLNRIHSFLSLQPSKSMPKFPVEAKSEYHETKTAKLCKFMNYCWNRFFRQRDSKLRDLLQANPGPEMEQNPFPQFEVECQPEVED